MKEQRFLGKVLLVGAAQLAAAVFDLVVLLAATVQLVFIVDLVQVGVVVEPVLVAGRN